MRIASNSMCRYHVFLSPVKAHNCPQLTWPTSIRQAPCAGRLARAENTLHRRRKLEQSGLSAGPFELYCLKRVCNHTPHNGNGMITQHNILSQIFVSTPILPRILFVWCMSWLVRIRKQLIERSRNPNLLHLFLLLPFSGMLFFLSFLLPCDILTQKKKKKNTTIPDYWWDFN